MKRSAWVALKVLVTAALLVVLLTRVDLASVGATLGTLSPLAIVAALVLTLAAVAVSAWRWRRVLAYLGEDVPFVPLFGDTLVGTTYNLLLPTSVGGDVARGIRSARRVADREHAWASVLFERVMGLLSLVLVSSVGLLYGLTQTLVPILVAAILMALVLGTGLAIAPAPLRLAARVSAWGAKGLGHFLERLAGAFAGPLARPGARLETFGWSLAYQFVALTILIPIGWAWDTPDLVRAVYLGVPIALVASTLPISLGGHGLRESLFVVVLGPFGLSAERAFALSLVWLAANLFVGLVGLVVMAVERK
jgi:uncharacterized membrane protein YbhN (UPF0104 family)